MLKKYGEMPVRVHASASGDTIFTEAVISPHIFFSQKGYESNDRIMKTIYKVCLFVCYNVGYHQLPLELPTGTNEVVARSLLGWISSPKL